MRKTVTMSRLRQYCTTLFTNSTFPVGCNVEDSLCVSLAALVGCRAAFAEGRLEDIKRELAKQKDVEVAEALRRAQAEAEATVARLRVRPRRCSHRCV